jgi:hypothetical protein
VGDSPPEGAINARSSASIALLRCSGIENNELLPELREIDARNPEIGEVAPPPITNLLNNSS